MQSVRPHPTAAIRSRSLRLVPVARQVLGLAAVVSVLVAFVACASSQPGVNKSAGGDASYTSLSHNNKLRVVSDSWVEAQGYEGATPAERRANFYGKSVYTVGSGAAAVKVCEDSLFDGIVQGLDQFGFSTYAVDGSASAGGSGATQFLEVAVDGKLRHFALTKGMTIEAKTAYHDCLKLYFEVFNAIEGYQAGEGIQFESNSKSAGD